MLENLFPLGWGHYLAGGLLIGAGVALLFLGVGLVGGLSTFYSAVWSYVTDWYYFHQPRLLQSRLWRVVYALGLVLGALAWWRLSGGPAQTTQVPWWQLLLGGLLVGYGARRGNGCTSGHGICGLSSLQLPSLLAVLTFMATGIVTANVVAAFLK